MSGLPAAAVTHDRADTIGAVIPRQRPAPDPVAVGPVAPPTDDEVYGYLGPQRRWVQWLMCVAFLLAASSLFRFAGHSPWLWPLYGVLGMNVLGMVVSAMSGWNRRTVTAASHHRLVTSFAENGSAPAVDVFLPTCGEDLVVLANTYRYVSQMQWPAAVNVLVLDDADRPEVAALAEGHGFTYHVRPDRGRMKKAGNLAFGMSQSTAPFIVIFDADFCPRPDYLMHLVPYMHDQSVGIVQSPQYFAATSSMSWLERTAGATQELFYRWVQPSRDRHGAAICVGTCAVYRRSALEKIGGFAQIEHSEDVHTGIFLMRAGFRVQYVPVVVARGLCPDQLAGFLNQQYRWCNGSITLLRSGEAQRQPLTLRQRLCFWAGFLYYITTAVNVFTIHVPGLLMAMVFADDVAPWHFVPFMPGLWIYFALLPRVSRTRWRVEVLRVQMAYSFCHAVAIVHKLTGRTKGWVATGAAGKRSGSLPRTISKLGAATIGLTLSASWFFVLVGAARYGLGEYWAMVGFLCIYTWISLPLMLDFLRVLELLPERARPDVDDRAGVRGSITTIEFTAVTAVLLVLTLLASGLVDAVLPWS